VTSRFSALPASTLYRHLKVFAQFVRRLGGLPSIEYLGTDIADLETRLREGVHATGSDTRAARSGIYNADDNPLAADTA
jgi:hypothetical protein